MKARKPRKPKTARATASGGNRSSKNTQPKAVNVVGPDGPHRIRLDVYRYLKRHHMPFTKKNIRYARTKLGKGKDRKRNPKGKTEAEVAASAEWQIIYGRARVGGFVTFIHTTDGKTYLHLVVTLACHEIYKIREVYFDDTVVTWDTDLLTRPTAVVQATGKYAGLVRMQINYGSAGQSALSDAVANTGGKWTSNHRQRGCAHVYFRLKWDSEKFKGGPPTLSFLVDGKYDCIDPRTGSTAPGSSNPAILIYDYMTNTRYGMGISTSLFNTTRLQAACDVCDQSVSIAGGGTEARYTLNGHFGSDDSPDQLLEDMLGTMAGNMVWSEGKYSIYAGEHRTPGITLNEDDILSDLSIKTKAERRDGFNCLRGTFISPNEDYTEQDLPILEDATWIAADNGEKVWEDITLPFTTSAAAGQRLMAIEMDRQRQGLTVSFTATLKAYQAEVCENLYLSNDRMGWSSKIFTVEESQLTILETSEGAPFYAVELTLRETSSTIWDGIVDTAIDPAPNTTLPDPFSCDPPTGLTVQSGTSYLYIRNDGTIFARAYLTWTPPSDFFVSSGGYFEIQHKKTADSNWQDSTSVPGDSTNAYILDVDDGNSYDFRVRAVNALGVRSTWATATHTVAGKTAPPSNVSSISVAIEGRGIRASWPAVSDLDVREYEVRYGPTATLLASATVLGTYRTTNIWFELTGTGTFRFHVRAVDTSGNYSSSAATVDLTIVAPGIPSSLSGLELNGSVLLDWGTPDSGTLPLERYRVYKGDLFDTADLIGTIDTTAFTTLEPVGGTFTYWVVAVDSWGNEGEPISRQIQVLAPPGYSLDYDQALLASAATMTNAIAETDNLGISGPVNLTETYAQHFTNNGVTTIAGLIAAGFDFWGEPTLLTPGKAVWILDLGTQFSTAMITLSYQVQQIEAPGIVAAQMFYRRSPADSWTRVTLNETQIRGSDYRYVKLVFHLGGMVLDPGNATLSKAVDLLDEATVVLPTEDQTWEEHFTQNGFTTFQNFIDAGYTKYLQPSSAGQGSATWEFDCYTQVAASTLITATNVVTQIDATYEVTLVGDIYVKAASGDTWTLVTSGTMSTGSGTKTVSGTPSAAFRYVRYVLRGTRSSIAAAAKALAQVAASIRIGGTASLALVKNVRLRIGVTRRTDSDTTYIYSGDPNGFYVPYNLVFKDILGVRVTPATSSDQRAVARWRDVADPTGFYVYLFDSSGARIDGYVSWDATGLVEE